MVVSKMKEETNVELSRLSIHGLQQFGRERNRSKVMIFVWAISLAMAATLLGLQLDRAAGFYFSYPTAVSLQVDSAKNLKFPSVTFCSLGLVNKAIVMKIPIFQQLAEAMNQVIIPKRKKRQTEQERKDSTFLATQPNTTALQHPNYTKEETKVANAMAADLASTRVLNSPTTCSNEAIMTETMTNKETVNNAIYPLQPNIASVLNAQPDIDPNTPVPVPDLVDSLDHVTNSLTEAKPRKKRSVAMSNCYFQCSDTMSIVGQSTSRDCYTTCATTAGCLSVTWFPNTLQCYLYSFDCCQDLTRTALPADGSSSSALAICDGVTDPTGYLTVSGPYKMFGWYTFQCNSGYLSASTYPTFGTADQYSCKVDGTWISPIASCLPYCSLTITTGTGTMGGTAPYLSGSTATVTCNSQYLTATSKVSSGTYTCVGTQWSPALQDCIMFCAEIFSQTTGLSNIPSPYLTGTFLTFSCLSAYYTVTKQKSIVYTCVGTVWSPVFKPCLLYCPVILPTDTGVMSGSAPYLTGEIISFTCISSPQYLTFDLKTSATYTCVGSVWSPTFQACIRTCNSSYFDSTGTIPASPYLGGNSYTFTCNTQYLTTSKTLTIVYNCQTTGSWNTMFQTCYMECTPIVRPQVVMAVSNSEVLINSFMPSGSFSNFSCPIHFTMIMPTGKSVANCYNGSWDIDPSGYPYCLADCTTLDSSTFYPRLQIAYNNSSGIAYVPTGTIGIFSCNDSYYIYGQSQSITCVNGTWDLAEPDYPVCLEQQVAYLSKEQIIQMANEDNKNYNLPLASAMTDILSYIWSNLSDSMRNSMGFSLKDTMLGCTYGGHPCDTDTEIHTTQDMSSGNCFTFNHDHMEPLEVKDVGEIYGLHMIFDSQQQKFISAIATAGLKLIIHQQFEPFFSDSMGIMISPGYLYTIGMQKESEERLKTPSNCYSSPNEPNFYYYNNKSYLTEGCIRSEEQHGVVQSCNCGSPSLPILNGSLCGLDERSCVKNNSLTGNQLLINCPQPCFGIRHNVVISTTVNVARDPAFDEFNKTEYYIKNNIVAVKVYYLTLDQKNFVESLSYTLLNLLSDIGSSLGLLMGMSLVSIIEVVTLPLKLIWNKMSS